MKKKKKNLAKKAATKKNTVSSKKHNPSSKKTPNNAINKLNNMKVTLTIEELNRIIEQRAYELYLERGHADGDDINDWFKAEKEIKNKTQAYRSSSKGGGQNPGPYRNTN